MLIKWHSYIETCPRNRHEDMSSMFNTDNSVGLCCDSMLNHIPTPSFVVKWDNPSKQKPMWFALDNILFGMITALWHYILPGSLLCRRKKKGFLRGSLSNHERVKGLLNCLFRCRSKKTSKSCTIVLCEGNSPVTYELPHNWPVTLKRLPFDDVIRKPSF